jgi:hypothetical protein
VFIPGSRSTSMGVERDGERTGVQPLIGGCMDVRSTATGTSGSECVKGKLNVITCFRRGTGPKIVSCGDILLCTGNYLRAEVMCV